MTRPATLTQADCKRLARVAKAEGVCIEVQAGEHVIRILPGSAASKNQVDEVREIDLG